MMAFPRLELAEHEEVRAGVPLKFRITTVPLELMEEVVHHMAVFFIHREPMCSSQKLHEDPVSVNAIKELWRNCVRGGAALVALRDGPEEEKERIIGANMTFIEYKDDHEKPQAVIGTKVEPVYDAVSDIGRRANIFEKYGVDKYLSAFGLSVDANYHGYKIGERLLQARKPLCKALGIKGQLIFTMYSVVVSDSLETLSDSFVQSMRSKVLVQEKMNLDLQPSASEVTGTVFTNVISMHLSKKIGFKVLYEEEFGKFTYNGKVLFKGVPGTFEESAWDFT